MLTGIKNFKAFTLAEVLITLGIIGVVAALTIPTVLSNYQKQQYLTGLKKAYSTFNQVLAQISADKGCVNDLKCTGIFDTTTTQQSLGDELVKYFNVVKNCSTSGTDCFPNKMNTAYDGSGAEITVSGLPQHLTTGHFSFITNDGMAFLINNYQNNCILDFPEEWSNLITNNMTQICAALYIDINGPQKGPNYFGRDLFQFYITNGKGALLYPLGGADDSTVAADGSWFDLDTKETLYCYQEDPNGFFCGGRIIEEGWQINY